MAAPNAAAPDEKDRTAARGALAVSTAAGEDGGGETKGGSAVGGAAATNAESEKLEKKKKAKDAASSKAFVGGGSSAHFYLDMITAVPFNWADDIRSVLGAVVTVLLGPMLTALVTLGLLPMLSRELASFLGGGGDGTSYTAGTGMGGTGVMTGTSGSTGSSTGMGTKPSSAGFALDGGRLIIDSTMTTMTMVDEDIGGVGGVRNTYQHISYGRH